MWVYPCVGAFRVQRRCRYQFFLFNSVMNNHSLYETYPQLFACPVEAVIIPVQEDGKCSASAKNGYQVWLQA